MSKVFCNHCGKKVFAQQYTKRFCNSLCQQRFWKSFKTKHGISKLKEKVK